MLTFIGLDFPGDPARNRLETPKRAATLRALQDFFHTTPAQAFLMLDDDALSTANPHRGRTLVISSHGNPRSFGTYAPEAFLDLLVGKGFEQGSFEAIYLMSCNSADAPEDSGVVTNFAIELKRLMVLRGIDCKVYGTRGKLSFELESHDAGGGSVYYTTLSMCIRSPSEDPRLSGHTYGLDEGLLLAQVA